MSEEFGRELLRTQIPLFRWVIIPNLNTSGVIAMKISGLIILAGLLVATFLAVAPVRADSTRDVNIQPANQERALQLNVTESNERLFAVSDGKNAGGTFGLSRFRPTVDLHYGDDQLAGPAPVPEPATMILLGTGLAGLGSVMRRKRPQTK